MVLEVVGADGRRQAHEVGTGERSPGGHTAATLGLGLEEGKAILAAVQRHLIAAQVEEHCRDRRRCGRCGAQRPLKDLRPRRLTSLFGVVVVRAPRFGPCRCGVARRRSITPVAEIMPDRCTPEYERVVAAMGAALPYRRALRLLAEFFPLGNAPVVETTRQRTPRVGARPMVTEGRASDAGGPHRRRQRYPDRGSRARRALGPTAIPPSSSVRSPRFWTVSRWVSSGRS